MKHFILLLNLICISAGMSGQNEFKHKYLFNIKSEPSNYKLAASDSSSLNNEAVLLFEISDSKRNPLPFVKVKVIGKNKTEAAATNKSGSVQINRGMGAVDLEIWGAGFIPLTIKDVQISPGKKYAVSIVLGKDNSLVIGEIHSKRELTQAERDEIAEAAGRGKKHRLVRQEICYTVFQI